MKRKTFYSETERNYLIDKKNAEGKYSKEYVYQIRTAIKNKIEFMLKDIELFLDFNQKMDKKAKISDDSKISELLMKILTLKTQIIEDSDLNDIVKKILTLKPKFFRDIIKINRIGLSLEQDFTFNKNDSFENFLFDVFNLNPEPSKKIFENVLDNLDSLKDLEE